MGVSGNIRNDKSLLFCTITHPNIGTTTMNANLLNIKTSQISDTTEVSDPGVGGGRVISIIKDNAKKIEVEVQNLSADEAFFRRIARYKGIPFVVTWSDSRSSATSGLSGTGNECYLMDTENDRTAESTTFEITSLSYTGD